jgi:hypothetical protein
MLSIRYLGLHISQSQSRSSRLVQAKRKMIQKICKPFPKSLLPNVNATTLTCLAMKYIKSRATRHKSLRSNLNAILSKTSPNRLRNTLNCKTLRLMTIIHSNIQEKLLLNPKLSLKKQNKMCKLWQIRVITWQPQWMEQLFSIWIFKLNWHNQIKEVTSFKNSHCLDLISLRYRLSEALSSLRWILKGEALIKLLSQAIKARQVEAVKYRKRRKKEAKVHKRISTSVQAAACLTSHHLP